MVCDGCFSCSAISNVIWEASVGLVQLLCRTSPDSATVSTAVKLVRMRIVQIECRERNYGDIAILPLKE